MLARVRCRWSALFMFGVSRSTIFAGAAPPPGCDPASAWAFGGGRWARPRQRKTMLKQHAAICERRAPAPKPGQDDERSICLLGLASVHAAGVSATYYLHDTVRLCQTSEKCRITKSRRRRFHSRCRSGRSTLALTDAFL